MLFFFKLRDQHNRDLDQLTRSYEIKMKEYDEVCEEVN